MQFIMFRQYLRIFLSDAWKWGLTESDNTGATQQHQDRLIPINTAVLEKLIKWPTQNIFIMLKAVSQEQQKKRDKYEVTFAF